MKVKRPAAFGALALEESEAWGAYLEVTSEIELPRYLEVEPWAWSRLNQKLSAIQARRRILEDSGA